MTRKFEQALEIMESARIEVEALEFQNAILLAGMQSVMLAPADTPQEEKDKELQITILIYSTIRSIADKEFDDATLKPIQLSYFDKSWLRKRGVAIPDFAMNSSVLNKSRNHV
jgi:hypothetical protein